MSKFDVEIRKEKHASFETYCISATHNGYQWTTISFDTVEELEILYHKIRNFINHERMDNKDDN